MTSPSSFADLDFYVALPRLTNLALSPDGARLVTSVDDIAEEIQTLIAVPPTRPGPTPSAPAPAPVATGAGGGLNDDEQRLLAALGADDDCSVDDLVRASGLEPGRVNGLLVGLQIKRRIRLLPGARVTRWA